MPVATVMVVVLGGRRVIVLGRGTVDGPDSLIGSLFLFAFLETMIPPMTPPTTAPMKAATTIAPITMKALCLFHGAGYGET